MRHVVVLFGAVLLAATVAFARSAAEAPDLRAAPAGGGGDVATCGGGSLYLDEQEVRTLRLHNQTRAERGLRKLCVSATLTKAARAHSREMIDRDYFAHNSHNGETPAARLRRFGYDWRTYGENVAWGSGPYASPGSRFETWMKSTGHRTNILDKRFREIGVGTARGTFKGNANATTYTVDFGTRR